MLGKQGCAQLIRPQSFGCPGTRVGKHTVEPDEFVSSFSSFKSWNLIETFTKIKGELL